MNDVLDTLVKFVPILKVAGPGAFVCLLWYWSDRNREWMMNAYREDTQAWRRETEQQLAEQRRMYEANVELVRGYAKVAEGMQDLIVLNTRAMERVCKTVEDNQYCPMVRLKKDAPGRIE